MNLAVPSPQNCVGYNEYPDQNIFYGLDMEIEQLKNCTFIYYDNSHFRRNIPVIVKALAVLADRPERCAMNYILSHTGTTTKRWGYAAYLNKKYIPSCSLCFKKYYKILTPLLH